MIEKITSTYSRNENGQKLIDEFVGSFYHQSAEYYFNEYKQGNLSYEDMKIRFSYDLLEEIMNLSRKWNITYYQENNDFE